MVLLLLVSLSVAALFVILCACRAGHVEDVARGFVESPAMSVPVTRTAPLPARAAVVQADTR